jgi:hypothetical protein
MIFLKPLSVSSAHSSEEFRELEASPEASALSLSMICAVKKALRSALCFAMTLGEKENFLPLFSSLLFSQAELQ